MEKIFNVGFKKFLSSPFSLIMFTAMLAIAWFVKDLVQAKNVEIIEKNERLKRCDEERRKDKELLQEVVFQKKINKTLKNGK